MFAQMVTLQAQLFLFLMVGLLCRYGKIVTDEVRSGMISFTIHALLPCMIFDSFDMEFSRSLMVECGFGLIIAVAIQILSYLCGSFLFRKNPPERESVLRYGFSFSNSGFAGLPICAEAFGSRGAVLGSFFMTPQRIVMWSVGLAFFNKGAKRKSFRGVILHPAMIGLYLGLIRMLTGIRLPDFIDASVGKLGSCTTPISMALVGTLLADTHIKDMFHPEIWKMLSFRHFLLPIAALLIARLLKVDAVTAGVAVTMTGMPIASLTAIVSDQQGADSRFASTCVFVSTLISLITVPVLTLLL